MNDNNHPIDNFHGIIRGLEIAMMHIPSSQVLAELHVTVERLSFVAEEGVSQLDIEVIYDILDGDVSGRFLKFVHALLKSNKLSLLIGESGRHLIQHITDYYRDAPEVEVLTAVELPLHFRQELVQQLRAVHPEPHRIVFAIMPDMVAGIMLKTSQGVYDYSLRTAMKQHLPDYVKRVPILEKGFSLNGG